MTEYPPIADLFTRDELIIADSVITEPEPEDATIVTPLGKMTPAQYAAYIKSLTPEPFHLSRPENYAPLPSGGDRGKWDRFFDANPAHVFGSKSMIEDGLERDLVSRFGVEYVKQVKRTIATNAEAMAVAA